MTVGWPGGGPDGLTMATPAGSRLPRETLRLRQTDGDAVSMQSWRSRCWRHTSWSQIGATMVVGLAVMGLDPCGYRVCGNPLWGNIGLSAAMITAWTLTVPDLALIPLRLVKSRSARRVPLVFCAAHVVVGVVCFAPMVASGPQ